MVELLGIEIVTLLGEGTFHQLHGGVATNASVEKLDNSWERWARQYQDIRGRPYAVPLLTYSRRYIGSLPRAMLARFARRRSRRLGAATPASSRRSAGSSNPMSGRWTD